MPFTVNFQSGQSVNFDKQPTPQDIQEVADKLGINKPQTPQSNSQPQEGGIIRSLIGAPLTMLARPIQAGAELLGASEQQVNDTTKKLTGGLVAPVPSDMAGVKQDIGRGVQTIALGMPGLTSAGAAFGLGSSLEQGNDLFSWQTAFDTALGAGGAKVLGLIGKPIFNVAGKAIGKITPEFLSNIASEGTKAIEDFAAQHNILPESVSGAINKGAKSLENITNKPFQIAGNIKNAISNKVSTIIGGKTEAEILATPINELKNLTKAERDIYNQGQQKALDLSHQSNVDNLNSDYLSQKQKLADEFRNNKNLSVTDFENQKNALDKKFQTQQDTLNQTHTNNVEQAKQKNTSLENQVNADLQAKTDASLTETNRLKAEVDKTSVAEAGNLKKPVLQIYKNNSNHFQQLFEEEFTPAKQAVPLKQADLISKLDSEFVNDPFSNPKDKLGLDPQGKDITAKDFYDRVRGLKTSSAGSRGTSTFTANDMAINRTRGVLNDVLGDKGVDLTKANDFWKEWKPLQREITAKVKPFEPGYKTGTMANILKDSASVVGDAKNAKFIADLEYQLGEKIGGDTRVAVENLSTAQKQMIADKVSAEEAKATALLERNKAINESSQALDSNMKKLKDNYISSKDALDKAGKEGAANLTENKIAEQRRLQDNYTQAKRALEDAKVKMDSNLKSQQIEIERQAKVTRKAVIKKILKTIAITGVSVESLKKLITGSF